MTEIPAALAAARRPDTMAFSAIGPRREDIGGYGGVVPREATVSDLNAAGTRGPAAQRQPGGPMPALPAQPDLPAIEHEMLARWNRERTFDASLGQTDGAPRMGCAPTSHAHGDRPADLGGVVRHDGTFLVGG